MALRGRRIEQFLELWWLVASGVVDIWVSSTNFQKSNISWPRQPLTRKVVNFNMIFHDSTPKKLFSRHKNKAESNCQYDSEVLSSGFSGLKTSAASMTSAALTASMASMTSTASFYQKITDPDDLIIPSTKVTHTSPFFWNESSKIQFFTDIWYSSWRGCWGQPMSFFWKLVDKT